MALIVQKYGGTSVGSTEQILNVAKHIASIYNQGHQLIVVVSAMNGETNRLLDLGRSISTNTLDKRELDAIAATGEQVSIALLSQALKDTGIKAKSFCGWQIPIITSNDFTQARIKQILPLKIKNELDKGSVVIVAGFQGVSEEGDITTLGRGGSDTSAVAVAVALRANECQIYTDVNGIYTADPNKTPAAKLLDKIDGVSMLEAASLGTKVLHVRSCELAYRYKTNIRVVSSFAPLEQGTLVMNEENLEHYPINILSQEDDQVLFSLKFTDKPSKIICKLYKLVNIDMLQIIPNILSFVINSEIAKELLPTLNELYPNQLETTYNLTKFSLIGSGFRSNAQQNSKVWELLEDHEIFLTSHNEISLSILVHDWEAATVRTKLSKLI
jgi:aspartate kinase